MMSREESSSKLEAGTAIAEALRRGFLDSREGVWYVLLMAADARFVTTRNAIDGML